MTDKSDLDPTAADTAKQALLQALGASIGATIVGMLDANADCSCLTCQTSVLRGALAWLVHGESIEDVREVVAYVQTQLDAITDICATSEVATNMGPSPSSFLN